MKNNSGKKRSIIKRILISLGVIIALIIGALTVLSWPLLNPKSYTPAQANADIDSLVVYIERIHPDPYRQLSKEVFYSAVNQTKQCLSSKEKVTLLDIYYEASRLMAMFKEGHVSVIPPEVLYHKDMKLFPYFTAFHVEPGTHRLVLDQDVEIEGSVFKAGDELLEINEKIARDIVEGTLEIVSGESDGFRCALINERDNIPDILNVWLNYNMPAEVYRMKIKTASGVKNVDVKSVGLLKWFKTYGKSNADEPSLIRPPFASKMLNDSTLLFSFNECVTDGLNEFLKDMFAKANADGVRYLIIDNRYNTGGNSEAGDEVCRYLTDSVFNGVAEVLVRISEPVRTRRLFNMNGVFTARDTVINMVLDNPDSEDFKIPYSPDVRFHGKVYLLNSNLTFSAGADFASLFSYYKMGTIVGEETGGMTISSGDNLAIELPNTGLSLWLPYKLFINSGADKHAPIHGVLPDIQVDSESALDVALRLVSEGK